ncbi:hypothetical protein WME89_21790 [Sorangium sp. So ce321]|uniref:hypothetical protein n=1 Tax=Sorangium sp. So ce321 TaxID=3133300 RepID=UPI003F62D80A
MPRISDATLRAQIPTALLIGGDQALLARCQAAAMDVGIVVKACPVSMAAALAEERRPVVIVVTASTYALAPEGFEEIARDVVSTLVRVDEALTDEELEAMLTTAARESRKQRTRQLTPGRYSLMPADEGASEPRSERWSIGVMTPSRREAESTPLPRSGPRSAGAPELAYRDRVAAAVAAPPPERWGAGAPAEGARRPSEPAGPQSARLGVMAGFGAGPSSSRPRRDPPAPAGVVYARREPSEPPSARGVAYARRDTPVPASRPGGAYPRRDTPVVGSMGAQPAGAPPWREGPPAAPYARRDTPAPATQPAGGYPGREGQAAAPSSRREGQAAAQGARRETLAPSSQAAAPSSWRGAQAAAQGARRETLTPSSQAAAPSSRREGQAAAQGARRETLAPSSQAAAPSSRREMQQGVAEAWRETPVPVVQRAAASPRQEPQPAAASSQREALASGSQGDEAQGRCYPTPPPPSSHRAPPSSRRAQFHVDIALLFDERGLPRADPEAK